MNIFGIINIGTGLILIISGLLCHRFPNLINPYGKMSDEQKALVDIDSLKWILRLIMCITGGLLIVNAIFMLSRIYGETAGSYVMFAVLGVMTIFLTVAMFKHNCIGRGISLKKGSTIGRGEKLNEGNITLVSVLIGTLGIILAFVVIILSDRPTEISIDKDSIYVSGMYSCTIPISNIISVELLEEMPSISSRTNGSSTFKHNKGHFKLSNGEKCMMYIRKQPPFIEIRTTDNLYYINGETKEETLRYYKELKKQ